MGENGQKWAKMGENVRKWPKMDRKWTPKMPIPWDTSTEGLAGRRPSHLEPSSKSLHPLAYWYSLANFPFTLYFIDYHPIAEVFDVPDCNPDGPLPVHRAEHLDQPHRRGRRAPRRQGRHRLRRVQSL